MIVLPDCLTIIKSISFFCREADESRLREVCESFLGPPTGMAQASSSDSKNSSWDPCVLVSFFNEKADF